jgi:chromosome segregation protein
MYLKSLEVHGFKSFAERTVLEFHKGVTGIVGPNGCGKSNVVDAVRWVLGETSAKALRGGEMADVIFNGTEKRKPLGMAEVTMTLADCEEALGVDYNEVSITRRVFRDGKGEYRINGTLCRLRDIHDLFADTGIGRASYSIMAQGQIDQILSSKPEERRVVFEEAAGITKFKREKKEALRKLEYTEANLLRVGDVLAEQERRMNSLKRQVSKARRYQELAGDVRVLDTHLAHRGFLEKSAQAGELRSSIHSFQTSHDELAERVPELEREVVEARHKAQALESELSGLRQKINEHRNALSSAESRITFNNERKAELEGRIKQNLADIETTREKLKQQEVDFEQANHALEEIKRRISVQEEQLAAQEEKTAAARQRRDELEQSLRVGRREMAAVQAQIASVQAKIESAVAQIEGTRERSRQLAEEQERMRQEIEAARATRDRIAADIAEISGGIQNHEEAYESSQRAYQRARAELETANAAAAEAHKLLATRSSRLDVVRGLVKRGEGFDKGTREVLRGLGEPERFSKGIHGPLAEFIEVDDECARAVEAALGVHLQAVLVDNGGFAAEILDALAGKKSGSAELLPSDYVGAAADRQLLTVPEGAVAWALDRVKADKRVLPVVERLLDNVLVVPDLATAMRMRGEHPDASFATVAGEWLGTEGIVRGGAGNDGGHSLLELRNEVRSLEKEVGELETADAEARARVEELSSSLTELEEAVAAARDRLERRRVDLSTREGELGLAERELESLEAKLKNVDWERGELESREQAAGESRKTLEDELESARRRMEELENSQARIQQEIEVAAREELDLSEALQELRTAVAVERRARQAAEEQQLPMEARLQELRELSARREAEVSEFTERIGQAAKENEWLAKECETHRAEAEKIEAELESRSAGRGELEEVIEVREEALDKMRREIAEAVERKGAEEVALTKIELKLENLVETIRER